MIYVLKTCGKYSISQNQGESFGQLPPLCPGASCSSPLFSLPLPDLAEHTPPQGLHPCHSLCPEFSSPRQSHRDCFLMSLGLCSSAQMSLSRKALLNPLCKILKSFSLNFTLPLHSFFSIEVSTPISHIFTFCVSDYCTRIYAPGGQGLCLLYFLCTPRAQNSAQHTVGAQHIFVKGTKKYTKLKGSAFL